MTSNINIKMEEIESFCQKWSIVELSLFGSVIDDNFRPDSDIDILIEFSENEKWDLFDLVQMQEELEEMFGRKVDLIEKGTIRNPFREHSIMSRREVLYAT